MENEIDQKEIEIILGLNNDSVKLNDFISGKKELTFISAISNILFSENLSDLYEDNESKEDNNEMIENFIKKAEIDEISSVKLELYKDSNFIENIKGNDTLLQNPQINYSEEYLTKLKTDFKKEEIIRARTIEISEKRSEKHEDKRKYKSKKSIMHHKFEDKKENSKKENQYPEEQKEPENQKNDEEDNKEIENGENQNIDYKNNEYEENEENGEKKNDGNNQYQNNRRPYNKKYNRNKGHKEFRQKVNSRKFKNYK